MAETPSARTESTVVVCVAVLAAHVLDDNFVHPEPGTVAGSHLVSGLVPVLLLVATAALYPRLRAGGRAVAGVAGVVLLIAGPVILWRSRRTGGSRAQRYRRRSLAVVCAPVIAAAIVWFLVFPIGVGYVYTHTAPAPTDPDLGVPYENVVVTTDDGLELTAIYAPSRNRAAVLLFPGAGRSTEARMLLAHGYVSGVARLLVDPSQAVMRAATATFSNHVPPPPIVDRIGAISPRPVLLIYADPGIGGESTRQPEYFAAAGDPKAIWEVPGASHTGSIDAAPLEYERRVVDFLDHALLHTDTTSERNRE